MSLYEILDPRFAALILPHARLEQLATGFRWTEGPVWFPAARMLLFSDIPEDRILRWTPDGACAPFRAPAGYTNGHTRDREGRLISCGHGTRSVLRTEHDGAITTLADSYRGLRLNAPNDVVVKSDGSIWFTDPTYGIMSDYEGYAAEPEQSARHVFRLAPDGGLSAAQADFAQPNGLAFSPDERVLYVAESGGSHDSAVPSVIRAFPVTGDRLQPGRDFALVDAGVPDGIRVDRAGNVWSSAADGVQVFAPDGTRIGRIRVPEVVANLCFGGPRGNILFLTATTSLYAVRVNAAAADWPG